MTEAEYVVLVNDRGEDLIDADGRIVTLEKITAHREGRRHRAVSVFVFSSRGEVMLQRRADGKYHTAGLWSNTCCTHPRPCEIPADAARRRLREEMGLDCPLEEIYAFSYSADVGGGLIENEFDHVFWGFCDAAPTPDPEEAADWQWVPVDALGKALAEFPERYAPWLRYCFPVVRARFRQIRLKEAGGAGRGPVFDYLRVDRFLRDIVAARSLATAFELGLIDHLGRQTEAGRDEISNVLGLDGPGLGLLLGLLRQNRVIEEANDHIRLTAEFIKALAFRDLLEAKIFFASVGLQDFTRLFTILIARPDQFFQHAAILNFFGYNRGVEETSKARESTARWMRITTVLTRYEAGVCLAHHDFSGYRRVLDVGGNSGEFMLQVCRRFPDLRATVFDLPVVCDIGRTHVDRQPERSRIEFIKGDARQDTFPGGFDLVCFKSMLHDWPDGPAEAYLAKAVRSLQPGGTLLIFERSAIPEESPPVSYAAVPLTLFFRCYRSPEWCGERLARLGFQDIQIQRIELDMRFSLITGVFSA
jgi:isopentenyl-diphosphate delta-isomerase type 1